MTSCVCFQVEGVEGLKLFLDKTCGKNLLHFWLDCEFFKDMMEDYDETQINATRNRLFRSELNNSLGQPDICTFLQEWLYVVRSCLQKGKLFMMKSCT